MSLSTSRRAASAAREHEAAPAPSPAPRTQPPEAKGSREDLPLEETREIRLTWLSIAVTLIGTVAFEVGVVAAGVSDLVRGGALLPALVNGAFVVIVTFLIYGNLVYQHARLGYLHRRRAHRPAGREELDEVYGRPERPLVVLVPSYKEEPAVVRQTLLSAALQEYPAKHVVLLVDDPPEPSGPAAAGMLDTVRRLPSELQAQLREPGDRVRRAFERFEGRMWRKGRPGAEVGRPPALSLREEVQRLAALYEEAAAWLERWAAAEADDDDHTTALFTTQVLHAPATDFRNEAATLRAEAGQPEPTIGPDRLEIGYRRLMATFEVRLSAFERKGYVNLSHQPNKAMNLNAYLSLLGRRWREGRDPDGRSLLLPARPGERGLPVPKADYVITLDADSLLLPGYALRLIHLLERPGNEKVAVAQTPYSAVPQAPGPLERIAGATTDLQYIVHQGFTQHRATFWVGANALLRTAALADIGSHDEERGFRVRRYIQDRTVIEDTESSVDLVREGWQLVNYPERLSFSATPPDFGALLIQRRRWANGGLIILPKLLGYLARQPRRRMREGLMRFHYLTSITGANLGLLALLAIPFPTPPAAAWLPVSAFPYFALYARDLRQVGYRRMDAVRAYALNLALIPVNLGGVLKSVQQAWTRRRIPFHRTPKVEGRTPVPRLYLLAELALVAYCALWGTLDLVAGRWAHAGFQVFNVALLGYAIVRFIGWRQLWADLTSPRRG